MKMKRFSIGLLLLAFLFTIVFPTGVLPEGVYAQSGISWTMTGEELTSAGIFDSSGRLVRSLWSMTTLPSGNLEASWDGLDDFGKPVPAGDYTWKVIRNNSSYNNIGSLGNTGLPTTTEGHVPIYLAGVAEDANGDVYSVNDWDEPHFDIIKWSGSTGQAIMNTGHTISEAMLTAIAVEPDGSYAYVTGYGGDLNDRTQPRFSIWRVNLAPGLDENSRVESFTYQGRRIKVYNGIYGGYPSEGYPTPAYPVGATDADKAIMSMPLRSIAVDGPDSRTGNIYVTDAIGGRVIKYDKVTGNFIKQFGNLSAANGLALAPDGKIWVGYEHQKVGVLDPNTGSLLATPVSDLTEVSSLSIRNVQGINTLCVADKTGKIKKYEINSDGISLTQIGEDFGEPQRPGDSAADRMYSISSVAMDVSGSITVVDRIGEGARMQKLNQSFEQQWLQMCLEFSSSAAYGASNPDIIISSYRNAYQVNKETGEWDFLGTAMTDTPKQYFGNYESSHGGPPRVVSMGGNDFYFYPTSDSIAIYRIIPPVPADPQNPADSDRGPTLQLVSVLGGSQPGPDGVHREKTWLQENKYLWSWNDTEGDGEIDYVPRTDPGQAGEVKLVAAGNYPHYQWQWVRRGYTVDDNGWIWFASANRDHVPDVSYPFESEALYVIKPQGLNNLGNPIYDWGDAIKVTDAAAAKAVLGLAAGDFFEWKTVGYSPEDGIVYALASSRMEGLPQDGSLWMGGNVLFAFQMPDKANPSFLGQPKWWVPLPKMSVGMVPISGGGGALVGIDPAMGVVGHYNTEGMLLGSMEAGAEFRDPTREPWVVGRLDAYMAVNNCRDPRDGILDVFTEDNVNQRILWFRMDDSDISTIASGTVSVSASNEARYPLTVINGIGSGKYTAGTTVSIIAIPPHEGYTFVKWSGDVSGVADPDSPVTTVTTSGSTAILTAIFAGQISLPNMPANLAAIPGDALCTLTWTASSSASDYNVKRSITDGTGYETIATVNGTSYADTEVTNGTTYYYVVTAVNEAGESGNSGQVSARPAGADTIPAAPEGLAANAGDQQVTLSWNASLAATGYNVKRMAEGEDGYTTIAGTTGTGYTDTGLTNGTTYRYVVSAVNAAGESPDSKQVNAMPGLGTEIGSIMYEAEDGSLQNGANNQYDSSASQGETVGDLHKPGASVTWNNVQGNGQKFRLVFRYATANDVANKGLFLNGNRVATLAFTSTGGWGGSYYSTLETTVTLNNGLNVVSLTNDPYEDSGLNLDWMRADPENMIPTAPAELTATPDNAQVALTWKAGIGAASYNIYRGTSEGGEDVIPVYTGVTGTSKVDTGLANGTTYYYTVKAVNSNGTSGASNEASATPLSLNDKIRYYPRATWESRMFGGIFEGTDGDPVNGPYTTIYTISSTPNAGWNEVAVNLGSYRYLRFRSANGCYGNVAEIEFYRGGTKLTGTGFGSAGSYGGSSNTFDKALDGDTSTFFDAPTADGNYMGIDTRVPCVPEAPTGLTAVPGSSQVKLSWAASDGAESYNVYRGTSAGSESSTPVYTGITDTTMIDSGLTNGKTYFYTVRAVNSDGVSTASNEVSARPTVKITGCISREVWFDIKGNKTFKIPLEAEPDIADTLTSFETLSDWADNYGTRIRGYITAPATGSYTFWIASDDDGELWLSTDSKPANKVLIATSKTRPDPYEWNKEHHQKSVAVNLEQGKVYYIEALHRENNKHDYLAVGWSKPGESTIEPSEVIPGYVLSPFSGDIPMAPTDLTATPELGKITLSWTASTGATSYNIYRATSPGGGGTMPFYMEVTGTAMVDMDVTRGTTYYYTIQAANLSGESAVSGEVSATPPAPVTGYISREVWTGIGGTNVADIPVSSVPDIVDTLTSFEAPKDWDDNYGTRIRGYIIAPETGSYTFWISSDDSSELWLSTDDNPANKVKIAWVREWTNSREWTKESNQKSYTITLVKGQKYYIEALQKEGGVGDNLAVGWAKPGELTLVPSEVIPGSVLSPFEQ